MRHYLGTEHIQPLSPAKWALVGFLTGPVVMTVWWHCLPSAEIVSPETLTEDAHVFGCGTSIFIFVFVIGPIVTAFTTFLFGVFAAAVNQTMD